MSAHQGNKEPGPMARLFIEAALGRSLDVRVIHSFTSPDGWYRKATTMLVTEPDGTEHHVSVREIDSGV